MHWSSFEGWYHGEWESKGNQPPKKTIKKESLKIIEFFFKGGIGGTENPFIARGSKSLFQSQITIRWQKTPEFRWF